MKIDKKTIEYLHVFCQLNINYILVKNEYVHNSRCKYFFSKVKVANKTTIILLNFSSKCSMTKESIRKMSVAWGSSVEYVVGVGGSAPS